MPPANTNTMVLAPVGEVRGLLVRLLVANSLYKYDAETVADRLIAADLRGEHACGAASVLELLKALDAGDADPRGCPIIVHETPAITVLDGSRAPGPVAGVKGMQSAIAKARHLGIGAAVVGNSQPLGAASAYALLAAEQGVIGMAVSLTAGAQDSASGRPAIDVKAPWSWAVPLSGRAPLVLDFGTPQRESSRPDPSFPSSVGPEARGVPLVASVLALGLAGGRSIPARTRRPTAEDSQHYFEAIDPAAFGDSEKFGRSFLDSLRWAASSPPTAAHGTPHDPLSLDDERASRIQRDGIPVPAAVYAELGRRTPGGWKPDASL